MMEQKMNKELLSAMVDGELRGEELEQALACAESAEGCASWELYHLVGDVLRSPDLAHHSQHDLLTGLRAQLAQEPALQLQSSQLQQVAAGMEQTQAPVVALRDPAANHSVFRWKVAASFATVAAMAALGWNLVATPVDGQGAQLASAPGANSSVVVATENGSVLRDPRLDALLANHQQYASRASLQTPADFLRNASFEEARSSGRTAK
ncbi:sigma-E factor negative regulatory protein [Comamonas jiangduensis]|jgi:sigma-E factor negative regulatory protein RseA|uniref:sigma-E factor negative regulatory protein n=1 Tax=Comamonas jiangduensis TaxID=1194168 RepID=UPI0024E17FB2|nr:sigma-E factor negative regulatory protein [Comamonas jiangduensis]